MNWDTYKRTVKRSSTSKTNWLFILLVLISVSLSPHYKVDAQTTADDSLFDAMVDQYVSEAWKNRATTQVNLLPGIDTDGILGSYIYIDDFEVRHEMLIPLIILKDQVWVRQADSAKLTVDEQDSLNIRIEAFFAKHNPVRVDGIVVEPILVRTDYYTAGESDLKQMPERETVEVNNSWAGIILSYSTKGSPEQVEVTWDLFNDAVREVRTAVYAYEDNLGVIFTPVSNTFSWISPGRPEKPPITEIKASTRSWWAFWDDNTVSEDDARSILTTLLKNIYRAFDYHSESDTYDALAKSVNGDLLSELYLQINRSLKMQEQGGAISRIQEVEVTDGHLESLPGDDETNNRGFGYQTVWTVKGTVEHWGHIHSRTNQYEALFTVEEINDSWKITDMKILSQERIKFESTVRKSVTALQPAQGK